MSNKDIETFSFRYLTIRKDIHIVLAVWIDYRWM